MPFALAIAASGAGVTIMMSGYLTGGELALPLAGAIGGAAVASLLLRMLKCNSGMVGVGVLALFAVIVLGRFFGNLTMIHGTILLAAPLLGCVPRFLPRKLTSVWLRAALSLGLAVIPVAIVVADAREKFVQESAAKSSSDDSAADDYLEYR